MQTSNKNHKWITDNWILNPPELQLVPSKISHNLLATEIWYKIKQWMNVDKKKAQQNRFQVNRIA